MFIDVGVSLKGIRRSTNTLPNPFGASWGDVSLPIDSLLDLSYLRVRGVNAMDYYGVTQSDSSALGPNQSDIHVDLANKRQYDGPTDFHNFGNFPFYLFNTGSRAAPPSGERFFKHLKLTTDLGSGDSDLYPDYEAVRYYKGALQNVCDQVSEAYGVDYLPVFSTVLDPDLGAIQNPAYRWIPGYWGDIERLTPVALQNLRDVAPLNSWYYPPKGWYGWNGGSGGIILQGAEISRENGPLTITYTGISVNPGWYLIHYKRTLTIDVVVGSSKPDIGFVPDGRRLNFSVYATYRDTVSSYSGYYLDWIPVPGWQNVSSELVIENHDPENFVVSRSYSIDDADRLRGLMKPVLSVADSKLSPLAVDLRPLSALSQADAVASLKSTSNWVETFAEFEQLGSLWTGPLGLGEAFMKALSSGEGFSKLDFVDISDFVKACADIAASGRLLYAFGIHPIEGDWENLRTISSRLNKIAESLKTEFSARGKHSLTFSLDGEEFSVIARSTIHVRKPSSSDVIKYIQFDNLGVLPLPSRVWEALPYAFIFDYCFKVGARLEAIEAFFFLSFNGLDYAVHSYKVKGKVPHEWFEDWDDHPIVHLEFYVREVTVFVADFSRQGRLNTSPPRGPSTLTLFALLWQIIRSIFL